MELKVQGQAAYAYTGGKAFATAYRGDEPVVVFIHGAEQDHSGWTLQSRWFAYHGYRVLAPDLPGHGRSAGGPLTSIEALADWIVALLDAAGIARARLVGHSMGSLIALAATSRHPARIEQLALIGSAVPMPVSDVLLGAAQHDEPQAARLINDWSHSPRGLIGGNTVPGLWLLGMNQQLMARQKPGVFYADLNACNQYAPSPESLRAIASPVLIVAGSSDRMTPPKAVRQLAEQLGHVRQVMLTGAGHALMAEQPDAVLDALRAFILVD